MGVPWLRSKGNGEQGMCWPPILNPLSYLDLESVTRSAGACAACRADLKAAGLAAGTLTRPTTTGGHLQNF